MVHSICLQFSHKDWKQQYLTFNIRLNEQIASTFNSIGGTCKQLCVVVYGHMHVLTVKTMHVKTGRYVFWDNLCLHIPTWNTHKLAMDEYSIKSFVRGV